MTDPETLALQRQIAELQAQLAARQATAAAPSPIASAPGDGAHFAQAVSAGGHVIGRDFVQIVRQSVFRSEDPAEAQSVIAHYLDALARELAGIKLGGIDPAASDGRREPLQLADVYVPLDSQLRIPASSSLTDWLARRRRGEGERNAGEQPDEKTRAVSLLEALAQHRRLGVIGSAGSGKSTFAASVLLALAQAWQGHAQELARLGEHWQHGALLPIRVVLRRFAEWLPAGVAGARAGDLWQFIGQDLADSGYGLSARTIDYVQRIAREHGALIVFDGLDECGSEARRQRVVAAVEELMRSAGKRCRFVLTARPYAWPGGAQPEAGVYALAELDKAQIAQFIGGWYAALVRRAWLPPGEAGRKRDDLLAASQRRDLLPLARNPLLLTLMTTLHANRGRLPDDRADLYDESVELLLLRWNQQIGADRALLEALDTPGIKLSDLRAVLERLAFEVHQEDSGSGTALLASNAEAPSHSAEIGEGRLLAAFRPLLKNDHNKAAIVVDYIEKRAGLLVGQGERAGERKFVFPHRTFQEFLAACYLTTRSDFAARCRALALAAPGHWQVVLPLAARIAKAERGASAADRLICCQTVHEFRRDRQPQAAEWACAVLAGLQLLEIGMAAMRMDAGTNAIARRVAGWLVELLPIPPQDGGLPAQQRALAGDILAQLGDPRFDAQRLFLPADDWLGFVHIAADADFRIGTRRADSEKVRRASDYSPADYERNDQPTPTPEFYFGRYLVTVAQFRAFVEATGHELHDARALHDAENRPVRLITWYEAVKYCEWLHERLHSDGAFARLPLAALVRAQGWQVTLPSELEWEKAARGGLVAAVYPWGDEFDANRANVDKTGIGDTTAVGAFPPNAYGLYDCAGNLWEWTRSLWGEGLDKPDFLYPYHADDAKREDLAAGEDILRVVRGGSWSLRRVSARCAVRLRRFPYYWLDNGGFRVLLRRSPVSLL